MWWCGMRHGTIGPTQHPIIFRIFVEVVIWCGIEEKFEMNVTSAIFGLTSLILTDILLREKNLLLYLRKT